MQQPPFIKNLISLAPEFIGTDHILRLVIESIRILPDFCAKTMPESARTEKQQRAPRGVQAPRVAISMDQPSSRTKGSFWAAAKHRGFEVVKEEGDTSRKKGESCMNSMRTLIQQGADLIVVRSSFDGLALHLAEGLRRTADPDLWVRSDVSIINGGCGSTTHPSQGLLDLTTLVARHFEIRSLRDLSKVEELFTKNTEEDLMARAHEYLNSLTIAFVGSNGLSRVVTEWIHIGQHFTQMKFLLVGPKQFSVPDEWMPKNLVDAPSQNLRDALRADVVYTQRMRTELLEGLLNEREVADLVQQFQITPDFVREFNGVIFEAQPLDELRPMIYPALWGDPRYAHRVVMFQQAFMGPVVRSVILDACNAGRSLETVLPTISPVVPRYPEGKVAQPIEEHFRELAAKQDLSINPIREGMVLDRITAGLGGLVELINLIGNSKLGSAKVTRGKNYSSTELGKKDVLFLHNVLTDWDLVGLCTAFSPQLRVSLMQDETYHRYICDPPPAVRRLIPCPHKLCIPNNDPEGEHFLSIRGNGDPARPDYRFTCRFCEREMSSAAAARSLRASVAHLFEVL